MTQDEMLVAMLREVAARVFHLEVYQKEDSQSQYPCVVYWLSDVIPERELDGNNGHEVSGYTVVVIAKDSATLRPLADAIAYFGVLAYNQTKWADTDYSGLISVDTDSQSEDENFAMEQQEKGLKTSTLSVSLTYARC